MKNLNFVIAYIMASLIDYFKVVVSNARGELGVNTPAALPAQSQLLGFEKELQMKQVLKSIYVDQKGHYNAETKKMSPGIYMEVDSVSAFKGAHTGTITMVLPYRETGVYGNDQAVGEEEDRDTKAATVYRNNCRKPVSVPNDGVRLLDQEYLNLVKEAIPGLADWNRDEEDLEIHQALLETYGETLLHGDTATDCVSNWNANMLVAGLDQWSQPAYSSNPATYTNNIVAAILEAGGGSFTPTIAQTLTIDTMSMISNVALARRINRLPIPGAPNGMGFIVTISELQAMYMGDPTWTANNFGSLYLNKNQLNEKVMNWTGAIGMWKDLLFVVDERAATVTPSGSSEGSYAASAGYMWHGDTDLRNRDNPYTRDVVTLHGQGAVWKWNPIKTHIENEMKDYNMVKGICSSLVRGVGSLIYDQQTPAAGTHEQFSSMAILCGIPR